MEPGGPELFDSWQSMVRVCERVLDSRDDAEDCAQEALLQAYAEGIDDVDNVEAYLVAIAKRRAMDVLRRRVRTRRQLLRLASRCEVADPDPAERVADESEARWLSGKADELLTAPARAVLRVVADGGSVNDAASRTGMSRRSVESHLHRARVTLRAARVAVPAFGLALARLFRRPTAATSVASVALVAGVAVVTPAFVLPRAPQATPPSVEAPVVERVTRVSREVRSERPPAVRERRTRPAAGAIVSAAVTSPARERDVTSVRTSAAIMTVTEEERESSGPVETVLDCVGRVGVDGRTIGC